MEEAGSVSADLEQWAQGIADAVILKHQGYYQSEALRADICSEVVRATIAAIMQGSE